MGILGVAAAGCLGSFYWNSYLRALGKAADHYREGRPDLAMRRLQAAVLIPPVGKLVDHWALCLNFQTFLYIQQNQFRQAEKRLELIRRRPGVSAGVKSLCFLRLAEINAARGLANEASACRRQALEIFDAEIENLEQRGLWKAITLNLYGTGDYEMTLKTLDRLLKHERSGPLLYLKWVCLAHSSADQRAILIACREALPLVKVPFRRANLLAVACHLEREPESVLEAGRACLKEQEHLGREAVPEVTKTALSGSLKALALLRRRDEYEAMRIRLMDALDYRLADDISTLGSILVHEGRFEEFVARSEEHQRDADVAHYRAMALNQMGRHHDALECVANAQIEEVAASTIASCHVSLLQGAEALAALKPLGKSDNELYRTHRSNFAYVWEGDPTMGAELWPHETPSVIGLRYKGDFEGSWEAMKIEMRTGRDSPDYRATKTQFYQGVNWLYLKEWEKAKDQFESLVPLCHPHPILREYCDLYALVCRCWLGEDALSLLLTRATTMRERYPDSQGLHQNVMRTSLQGYFASSRYEELLALLGDSIEKEVRAFYRGMLLDLRSQTCHFLGELQQAESDDRSLLSLVPESYLSQRARRRLELP
jgi:tetratricopeptide (TPR) repeat protein